MPDTVSIRVQFINGDEYKVALPLEKTVQDLKDGVYSQSSVSPSRQRLIYRGKELQDHVTLSDAGLLDGVVVHLVERMLPRPSEEPREEATTPGTAAGEGQAPASAAVGVDALSSILNQVFTGGFWGAARADQSTISDMRAARLRVNIRSMLAHDSNTLTVLAAYLSRANASDDLTTPPAAHPALTLQQATVRGRPTVSLRELTRAVVHAIDSCTQDGDDDFVAALELASGSPLSQNVAQRLRQLMAKARDEAGREKRRLLRALHFLQNRHRFTAGAAGAEEVGEEEMRAAREAAQNPNELPADLPNRVREIAEWLIGEREASNLQGPPGFRERGGEPAYEFQELAGVAFVLLAARSVSLMGRYQASVESRFSRVLSSFLSDLDRGGRRNYQATGEELEAFSTVTSRAAGLQGELAHMVSLYGACFTRNAPSYLSNLTPLLLRPDRFVQVTSADATPWPGPEATDATAAETTSGAASPRAQQEDRGLEGFVGPRGEGSRWRVSLNPRFEPLLGISRGYISTPGRSESSPRFRPGALVQTINIMQGQGGSAEGVPNAVQGDGQAASGAQPQAPQQPQRAASAGPATGADADSGEPPMQVEGLPIFTQHTRRDEGAPMGPGAGPMLGPMAAFGGIPGFPMPFGPDGGDDSLGTAVGGMVVELGLSGEGNTPTSIRASGFGDVSGVLRSLFDPHHSGPPPQSGGADASGILRSHFDPQHSSPLVQTGGDNNAPGGAAQGTPSPSRSPVRAHLEPNPTGPSLAATPQRDLSQGGAALPVNVQSPHDLQNAMATLAMQLSHDLDSHRSQELSDDERQTITERISLQYLQQVPDLMQVVAPRAGAHIQSLLVNLGHATPAVPPGTGETGGRGARDGIERSVASPLTLAQPTAASATPVVTSAPPAADASGAAPPSAEARSAAASQAEQSAVDAEMHASDEDFQDAEEPTPESQEEKGGEVPPVAKEAPKATDAPAAAAPSAAGRSTEIGSSGQQRPRPMSSPQGLGGGLKRRKNGRSEGRESKAGSDASTRAERGVGGASMGSSIATAVNPLQGLMAAMNAGGAPGGGAPAGAANPLQGLMAAMAGGEPSGAASRAGTGPMVRAGGAEPGGGAGLASLMQSMMPMMNSMLGGGAPGSPGRSGPSSGGDVTASGSRAAGQSSKNDADVLKAVLGVKEGKQWAEQIKKDRRAQARLGQNLQHSAAYTAGAAPKNTGGGLF